MRLRAFGRVMLLGGLALSGCDLAPVYTPPKFILPESYQGSGPFQVARPDTVLTPDGDWWTLFGDPELNTLEEALTRENPNLQSAMEQYTQARDLAAEVQSQLYPQIGTDYQLSDNRQSVNRLFRGSAAASPNVQGSNEIVGTASWEPDFWDQIRNHAHEQKRLAQASARLSLQAELASDYLGLRGLDRVLEVLKQSIVAYGKTVEVAQLRYHGGIASQLDLARAQNQLAVAQAQETETALQRDLLQHAVAVLVGEVPSSFSIPPLNTIQATLAQLPADVPSALLERRPDIASAERRMAAANASIGVSRAAFYPHVTFFGSAGYQDTGFNLISLPNTLWSIGSDVMLPLFEGGLRRAELQRSWSRYAQTRDNYRATVLSAFQEVEDGLSLTRRLKDEVAQQHEASDQAEQALSISTTLYEAGLDNYLSVSVAQVAALLARTSEVQVQIRQMQASVSLIRALGGGWNVHGLPDEKQTLPFGPLDYGHIKPE
jgi:NodT family efflux transporter outer membrane factor (OMF) lipoprotein